MEPRTLLAVLVPFSLGLFALPARACPAPQAFENAGRFGWPATLDATGPLRSPVAGRFVDPLHEDLYLLRNNQLYFLYQPGLFELVFAPTIQHPQGTDLSTIRDLARIPGASGACDSLALVAPSGLFQLSCSGSLFTATSLSASPNWNAARMLRAGDIDGSGGIDYLGLGSDRKTIVMHLDASSGVTEFRFTTPTIITALELVQWDYDSPKEVAVVNTYGVVVYELDGSIATCGAGSAQFPRSSGTSGGSISTFTDVGESRQRIAWVRTASSGYPGLVELSQAYGTVVSVPTLSFDAQSVTSIDVDESLLLTTGGEQGTDLLLADSASAAPVLFLNHVVGNRRFGTEAATWTTIDPPDAELGETAPGVPASSLTVLDFDLDGRPDLMFGLPAGEGGSMLDLRFLHAFDSSDEVPWYPPEEGESIVEGTPGFTPFRSITFTPLGEHDATAQLALDFQSCPAGATHLELTLWTESSETVPVTALAISHTLHAVLDPGSQSLSAQQHPKVAFPGLTLSAGTEHQCWGTTIYWFEARFVIATPNGDSTFDIQQSFPGYITYISTDNDATLDLAQSDFTFGLPSYHTNSGTRLRPCYDTGTVQVAAPALCTRRRLNTGGGSVIPVKPAAHEGDS